MALSARKLYYGEDITHMGPIAVQRELMSDRVIITFDHVGSGLAIEDGDTLRGFEICDADYSCKEGAATIIGNTVEVTGMENPKAVRYGWKNWPEYPQDSGNFINLTNSAGIPASPFRTDYLPSSNSTDTLE
jgi:sialate O-acetylesterase